MYLIVLLILSGLAVSLGLISAIANDRWILVPAGAVFLMCSMMILPSGIETKVGMEAETNETEISSPKTRLNNVSYREYDIYRNIDDKYDFDLSRFIATLYAGLGLFFIFRGVAGRGGPDAMPW